MSVWFWQEIQKVLRDFIVDVPNGLSAYFQTGFSVVIPFIDCRYIYPLHHLTISAVEKNSGQDGSAQ